MLLIRYAGLRDVDLVVGLVGPFGELNANKVTRRDEHLAFHHSVELEGGRINSKKR